MLEILKKHGIEVAEDKQEELKSDFFKKYKSAGEVETYKTKLAEAEAERDSYKEIAEKFDGQDPEELEGLKEELQKLKDAEEQRIKELEASEAAKGFEKLFDEAVGEKQFANPLIRTSVLEAVKKERETDQGSGIADILERVTKDQEGIFKNPNQAPNKLPTLEKNKPAEGTLDEETIRRITGLPDDFKL